MAQLEATYRLMNQYMRTEIVKILIIFLIKSYEMS